MKHVVITGGNKGIGLSATKLFLENGHRVTVIARSHTSEKFDKSNLTELIFDLTNIEEIPNLCRKLGKVDVLVNNAGLMNSIPYGDYPESKKDQILKINIEAPVAMITELSKIMIEQGGGRIVSTASIAGEIGHPDVWYGITKAGVINYTKSFAKILGSKGIIINCVAPGPVEDTDMFGVIPADRRAQLQSATVTGKFAKPVDIAETIYWLAVESPPYINGVCIDVNNGAYLR